MPDMENVNGGGGAGTGVLNALKSKEVLVPAALSAATAVAAAKAPDLLHKLTDAGERKGQEEAEQMGQKAVQGAKEGLQSGKGGLAGKALQKVMPGGGGGGGGKKTRRLPIERWTDVAVPVAKAYDAWNDFDQYPKFMHRVLSVEEKDRDKITWNEKIWFSKREWEGQITDRRKNDRIAWKTKSGMSHRGVVSFHEMSPNLTRVMVTMEFEPNGMIEKMASGMRFVKRAVEADLARFKAFVEMEDAKGIEYRSKDEDREENQRERAEGRESRRASAKES
jgi:ribosome-associated toxin RatA of RatAB toxin-antitoxin module